MLLSVLTLESRLEEMNEEGTIGEMKIRRVIGIMATLVVEMTAMTVDAVTIVLITTDVEEVAGVGVEPSLQLLRITPGILWWRSSVCRTASPVSGRSGISLVMWCRSARTNMGHGSFNNDSK
jgi:hypothetical protein